MAEKTVTVRLRALVDDYKRSMQQAGKATEDAAAKADRWKNLGQSTAALGDRMTRNVTLPIIAVGAAAAKMALDFDGAFTRMQGLAGVSAGEIDGLKDSVLGLAGETGRAPAELADALYFLRSSGLDGAAALDALEMSAKASAAGLGSTEVIADAVSSAMNAYAKSGLSAAEATDVLIATARAGKAEPEQLAQSLGRILPVSSQLGVSFEEVGGSIAALSLTGNDAAQSTTLLTNVMSKLLKPSQQGAEALEAVGLSVESVQAMIRDKGLIGTLEELRARLGDNGFVKFLEDQQAVVGALALTGDNLESTKAILDEVADSAGATESAFGTWAESMGAKNARAWAQLQASLIELGDVIAPIAANVAEALGTVADAFGDLPAGVQEGIVYFALFVAALGPVMSVGGRVVTTLSGLYTGLLNLAAPAGTVSGAFSGAATSTSRFSTALGSLGKAALVVGTLVALREVLGTIKDDVDKTSLGKLENELLDLAETGEASGATLKRVFEGMAEGANPEAAQQLASDIDQLDAALAQLASRDPEAAAASFRAISEALQSQGLSASEIQDRFAGYADAVAGADTANRTTQSAVEEAGGAFDEQANSVENAKSALERYAEQLQAQFDPLFGMISAQQGMRDAQIAVTDAQNALNMALAAGDPTAIAEAQRAYDDALLGASQSLVGAQSAQAALNDAVARGDVTLEDAKSSLYNWAINAGYTAEQASALAAQLDGATASAQWLDAQNPHVPVTGYDGVSGLVDHINAKLASLHDKTLTIRTNYVTSGPGGSGGIPIASGGIVPDYLAGGGISGARLMGPRGTDTIPAWLTPGEMVLNDAQQANLWNLLAGGTFVPAAAGGAGGPGGLVSVNVDARGAIISSEAQFERMVVGAVNRAGDRGVALSVRGRRL